MQNWIVRNKELLGWLFSGIGGTLLLGACGFVYRNVFRSLYRRFFSAANNSPVQHSPSIVSPPPLQPAPVSPATFTKPDPKEIFAQISALPPYQQSLAESLYKGLEVCWECAFDSISKSDFVQGYMVFLNYPYTNEVAMTRYIRCRVDLDAYPQLKIAPRNARVIVRGKIVEVDHGITLTNVTLQFI
jgi:hypothetical protein